MKVRVPIVELFENLENFYLQKIDFIEKSDFRENVKINELENIAQMSIFYKLENVFYVAQDAIERIYKNEC